MKKLTIFLLAATMSSFAYAECTGDNSSGDEICEDVPDVTILGACNLTNDKDKCQDIPDTVSSFSVGVTPVGEPICVGVGACYQKYCHDTGYCWYE